MTYAAPSSDEYANALALGPDGEIILAGSFINASGRDFAVLKLRPNGSPNIGFGAGGLGIIDLGGPADDIYGVVVQSDDGKIVVGGGTYNSPYDVDTAFARLAPGEELAMTYLPFISR